MMSQRPPLPAPPPSWTPLSIFAIVVVGGTCGIGSIALVLGIAFSTPPVAGVPPAVTVTPATATDRIVPAPAVPDPASRAYADVSASPQGSVAVSNSGSRPTVPTTASDAAATSDAPEVDAPPTSDPAPIRESCGDLVSMLGPRSGLGEADRARAVRPYMGRPVRWHVRFVSTTQSSTGMDVVEVRFQCARHGGWGAVATAFCDGALRSSFENLAPNARFTFAGDFEGFDEEGLNLEACHAP